MDNKRLTDEQRQFAADNIKLVGTYMRDHPMPPVPGISPADWECILYDAYVRAVHYYYNRADKYKDIAFATYAYKVMQSYVIREMRTTQYSTRILNHSDKLKYLDAPVKGTDDLYLRDIIPCDADIADAYEQREDIVRLRAAIQTLPYKQRTVLEQLIGDKSQKQIAKEMCCTVQNINQIYHDAVKNLRKIYEGQNMNTETKASRNAEIVNRRKSGESVPDLATAYGLSTNAIYFICKGIKPDGPAPIKSGANISIVADAEAVQSDALPTAQKRKAPASLIVAAKVEADKLRASIAEQRTKIKQTETELTELIEWLKGEEIA